MAAYARGYRNYAFYNRSVHGDATWFARAADRDAALEKLRAHAIERGLARSAAQSGICAVVKRFRTARERDAWLEMLADDPDHEGGNYVAEVANG
jgi:hypothetical protein